MIVLAGLASVKPGPLDFPALALLPRLGGASVSFLSALARLDAGAEVGAMAGEEKELLALRFNEGKAVFVLTGKGWKVAAKLTGSRSWPDEALNHP